MQKFQSENIFLTPVQRFQPQFRIRNELGRKLLAEFVATTILIYMGFCVGAQTYLSKNKLNTSLGTSIGWGLSLIFAAQVAYEISGSHCNPAISFSAWTMGQLKFSHFLLYSLVQTLASFFGAMLTYLQYIDKINEFDGGLRSVYGEKATAGLFATYPAPHLSLLNGVFDQVATTTVLAFIIGVVTDEHNKIPKWAQPSFFGMLLMTINLGFGLNSGNAINPARDFGPRLFTAMIGYGSDVFSYRNYQWFLIPVICPLLGATLGSWLYVFTIGIQMPQSTTNVQLKQIYPLSIYPYSVQILRNETPNGLQNNVRKNSLKNIV